MARRRCMAGAIQGNNEQQTSGSVFADEDGLPELTAAGSGFDSRLSPLI